MIWPILLIIGACHGDTVPLATSYQSSASWLRASLFVKSLTNAEKANLTTGIGLESRCSGNTAGVTAGDGSTAFPAQVVAASTWDVDLIYQRNYALGKEFRGKGVNVAYAPVTGGPLGRSPYGGRNWEGYGSDPYLNGIASYWGVKGLQDAGVIASPKHFVGYEQETSRWTGTLTKIAASAGLVSSSNSSNLHQIDSVITNRTLRELYLWPFEEAMRARPLALMCSYNRVNGEDACSNSALLDIAKTEWDFGGFVVSDYGAAFMGGSTSRLANGGLDMDMPGGEGLFGTQLVELVATKNITQERLDEMATRVMYAFFESGQEFDHPSTNFALPSPLKALNQYIDVQDDHGTVARKVVEAGTVLLKNSNASIAGLPLPQGRRIAMFGTNAGPSPIGTKIRNGVYPSNSTNNGSLFLGFGSGFSSPAYMIDPAAAFNWKAQENDWQVVTVLQDYPSQYSSLFNAATDFAETCLCFVAARAGETRDRVSLRLDNDGDALIKYVADRCADTIVVAYIPGPTNLEVPYNHPNVSAILNAGYPGQESGRALVGIVEGSVNPSGKLVYTILQNDADYIQVNTTVDNDPKSFFSENLLIDYRQADALKLPMRFEFGFGLSYTEFAYFDAKLLHTNRSSFADAGRDDVLMQISAVVKNAGKVPGSEVSQLYLQFSSDIGEPPKVLRGFKKATLKVGETCTIKFDVRKKDISYWNEVLDAWTLPRGELTFLVGPSSMKLPLSVKAIV